jgi:outer membrane protein
MKKKIFVSTLLAFSLSITMAQQSKLTLKQCVETGIANNLDVQQSGIDLQRSKIAWNQSRLDMLPDLNASASSGINQGRSIDPFTNAYINQQINYSSYGANSGVVLFNGFSMQNAVKQNKLAFEASKMDWQQAKDNLTINIILAYLQVLSTQDQLAQSRNQSDLSKKQVERLDVMNKNGAIPPSQFTDLQGQYANDQLTIISIQNTLESSKIALCQLMNVPYDKNMELEKLDAESYAVKYEDTPEKIYAESMKQFALIKAVDLRLQSSEKAVKVAKGQLFPTLSLNGNVNTNYSNAATNDVFLGTTDVTSTDYVLISGTPTPVIRKQGNFRTEKIGYAKQLNNNLFNSVSLNLRIPIFNSLFQRNRVKLAKLDFQNSTLVAKSTKTQLQQFIEQAYINMNSASERYKVLLDQVAAYKESFRAADIRFNAGLGTSIDYLTAKNNLDRANINLISAKYDYVLRTKILDYYQGRQLW